MRVVQTLRQVRRESRRQGNEKHHHGNVQPEAVRGFHRRPDPLQEPLEQIREDILTEKSEPANAPINVSFQPSIEKETFMEMVEKAKAGDTQPLMEELRPKIDDDDEEED